MNAESWFSFGEKLIGGNVKSTLPILVYNSSALASMLLEGLLRAFAAGAAPRLLLWWLSWMPKRLRRLLDLRMVAGVAVALARLLDYLGFAEACAQSNSATMPSFWGTKGLRPYRPPCMRILALKHGYLAGLHTETCYNEAATSGGDNHEHIYNPMAID
jgi:hypothetical protein